MEPLRFGPQLNTIQALYGKVCDSYPLDSLARRIMFSLLRSQLAAVARLQLTLLGHFKWKARLVIRSRADDPCVRSTLQVQFGFV